LIIFLKIRARTWWPYYDYQMNMIRHDCLFIQFHIPVMTGDCQQAFFHNLPHIIQHHFPVRNVPEQAGMAAGAEGYEIDYFFESPCPYVVSWILLLGKWK